MKQYLLSLTTGYTRLSYPPMWRSVLEKIIFITLRVIKVTLLWNLKAQMKKKICEVRASS